MERFDFITWEEIVFGEFIESAEISPDIMQSLDRAIDSIINELDNK